MNILLWIVQLVLAVFAFSGGAYKVFQFKELAQVPSTAALPQAAWTGLGVFEMACALLLIAPALTKWKRLIPHAAAALMIEALVLAAIFATYSLELVATNPLVWVVGMAVLAAFVAYGRYKLKPLA